MSKNVKAAKKTKGFTCRSSSATAVCMSQDYRSVIVPRRSSRTLTDHAKLLENTKYIRLGQPHKIAASTVKAITLSSLKKDQEKQVSSLVTSDTSFQVVVMRVSLHCQGCAGKVKKHLSKMEGVTSFSIDLESKRVTVMGHVSPSGVLESISKVKRAEFWPCN